MAVLESSILHYYAIAKQQILISIYVYTLLNAPTVATGKLPLLPWLKIHRKANLILAIGQMNMMDI